MEQKSFLLNLNSTALEALFFKSYIGLMILILPVAGNSDLQSVNNDKITRCYENIDTLKEHNTDSLIKPRIIFERDKDTGKKSVSFYNENGERINSFPRNQIPNRSPYSKLNFPYFMKTDSNHDYRLSAFSEDSPNYGFFDLTGIEFSQRKKIILDAWVKIEDSIFQKATRIIRTPVRIVSINDSFMVTNSFFYIINAKKNIMWRSEFLSVYNYLSKIVNEIEINQSLGWEGCLSNDGRYLLMFQSLSHDEVGVNGDNNAENWTEYGFPLKLLDFETGKETLISYDFQKSRVLEMKYFNNAFQLIYDTNEHAVVCPTTRSFYYKHYGNRKREPEPLLLVVQKLKPDLSQYIKFNF